jgi:hypothetical protein
MLPQERAALDRSDELRQRHCGSKRLAKMRVEPRALGHLGIGAAEEGRAKKPACCRKLDVLKRKPDEVESEGDERKIGKRLAERHVERHRDLRHAGKVVGRLHYARENPHHFLTA